MTRVIALTGALVLLWVSYALACSPIPGDLWFELSATVRAKTLPKNFALRAGNIEKIGARECVLANGSNFEGYAKDSFTHLVKNNRFGDGRPAHVKLPRPETVTLEVYCDRTRYVTHGHLSYRPMDRMPGRWQSYLQLDLEGVRHLITTRESGGSRDIYIDRVDPVTTFCTMSAEHLFDDPPSLYAQTFGQESLSLAELTRATRHVGSELRGITPQDVAKARTFEVTIDCYASKNIIEAKVRYALNKSYDPTQARKSAEACSRMQ